MDQQRAGGDWTKRERGRGHQTGAVEKGGGEASIPEREKELEERPRAGRRVTADVGNWTEW